MPKNNLIKNKNAVMKLSNSLLILRIIIINILFLKEKKIIIWMKPKNKILKNIQILFLFYSLKIFVLLSHKSHIINYVGWLLDLAIQINSVTIHK